MKKVIINAQKDSRTPTLEEITEMLSKKCGDEMLYEEAKNERFDQEKCYLAPDDEIDEFKNENIHDIHVQKQCMSDKFTRYINTSTQFLTAERKQEIKYSLPKNTVILEEYKELKIYERERTLKQYIKQYELKIISSYFENQLI